VSALEVDDDFQSAISAVPSSSVFFFGQGGSSGVASWAGKNSATSGVSSSSGAAAPLATLSQIYENFPAPTGGVVDGDQIRFDPPIQAQAAAGQPPPPPPPPKPISYYTYETVEPPVVEQYTSQTCSYFYYEKPQKPNKCNFTYKTELTSDFVCRSHDGCFDENTRIRMADGTDRQITLLKKGEFVFNPVTGQPARIVKLVIGPEDKPLIQVRVDGRLVKVTATHPFMTKRGWVQAKVLRKGDEILMPGRLFLPVTDVELGETGRTVVNVALEGGADESDRHYLLADGVVTGDLVIQNMIEARASTK
jgi:hypothetical protein